MDKLASFNNSRDRLRKFLVEKLQSFEGLKDRVKEVDDERIDILTKDGQSMLGIWLFQYATTKNTHLLRFSDTAVTDRVGVKLFNKLYLVHLKENLRFPVFNPIKKPLDPETVAENIFSFFKKFRQLAIDEIQSKDDQKTELAGLVVPPYVHLTRGKDGLYQIQIAGSGHSAARIRAILEAIEKTGA